MLKIYPRIVFGVLCALLGTALSSRASIVTFSGVDSNPGGTEQRILHPMSDAARAAFLANLTGVGTETFESFTANAIPITLTFSGAGTATLSGTPLIIANVPTGTNGAGRYPISGDQYLEANASSFSITFSQPVAAFGFYGVDIGDLGGSLTLQLSNGAMLTVPEAAEANANASVLYFGFLGTTAADEVTGITFNNSDSADVFAFDDMTIGSLQQVTPAPEPASVTLLGLGVAGLLGCGWWKRRSQ